MADIKKGINSITDLKRGSTNLNFVYRGATLIWQRGGAVIKLWLTNAFAFQLNSSVNKYETTAFKLNFKKS